MSGKEKTTAAVSASVFVWSLSALLPLTLRSFARRLTDGTLVDDAGGIFAARVSGRQRGRDEARQRDWHAQFQRTSQNNNSGGEIDC